MLDYQRAFLDFAIDYQVLRFGEFKLKSGRTSPYFFNTGLFNTGSSLAQLGRFYAQAIVNSGVQFDVLFGPAYKGIPLSSVTAAALFDHQGLDTGYAFNRKETKDHGEGGIIVGHPLKGRILIIDDVISAGTSVHESVNIIETNGAALVGIVIALDREEIGQTNKSAVQEIVNRFNVPVIAITSLTDLIAYVIQSSEHKNWLEPIQSYAARYGAHA